MPKIIPIHHKQVYLCKSSIRTVFLCPPCARQAKEENGKTSVRAKDNRELDKYFTEKVTAKNPIYCSNCCDPMHVEEKPTKRPSMV